MPQISVIVPVYNVEKYLEKCVNTILSQTFCDFEVILCDDGSKDKSGLICDEFAKKDDRVKVVHKENGGVVSARKCGVRLSQGKYISFVDGDDFVDEKLLDTLLSAILVQNADVAVSGYKAVFPDGKSIDYSFKYSGGYYDKNRIDAELFDTMLYKVSDKSFGLGHMAWAKLFRRDVLENSGLYDIDERIRVGEDVALCSGVFFDMQSLVIVPQNLYYYRIAEVSMTKNYDSRFLQRTHVLIKLVRKLAAQRILSDEKLDSYLRQLDCYTVMIYVQGIRNACEKSGLSVFGCRKIARHAAKKDGVFSKALKNVRTNYFSKDIYPWVLALKTHLYLVCVALSKLSHMRMTLRKKFS